MGVAKNSTREYVVNKTVSELNDINDILSSDADNSQQQQQQRKIRRKKKSTKSSIYSCRKNVDPYLTEVSAELGIIDDLEDIVPSHNSPLSSLFQDSEKMKMWLMFIETSEKDQMNTLKRDNNGCQNRFKRISRALRKEITAVPVSDVAQLEKTVYSTVKDFGYDGVVVFTPGTPKENVILTAISKYSKLKTTTHTVFNVIEIEVKKGQFSPPKIALSEFLSDMHSEKLL